MIVLAIDPGTTESAYVRFDADAQRVLAFAKSSNEFIIGKLAAQRAQHPDCFAIEMIASYGMSVGAEVFMTCVWVGRFLQAWGDGGELVYRRDVKLHLCGQARAKDGNVRQALIDRFGGKDKAIGKKASPGPLYGISGDVWQALAVAVTYSDGIAKRVAA